jgi:hypothetical protein
MSTNNGCIAIKDGIRCNKPLGDIRCGMYCRDCWYNGENVKRCKGYILKTGEPCLQKVKDDDDFCGYHNKHKLLYSEKDLVDDSEEEKEESHEDLVTFLEIGQAYKIMMDHNKNVIIEEDKTVAYFEKDLNKQFKDHMILDNKNLKLTETPKLLKYKITGRENRYRYFIIIKYNHLEIVFVPAFDIHMQMYGLGQILYEDFHIIFQDTFSMNNTFYLTNQCNKTLHELIYGKKAEKKMWQLVKPNDLLNPVKALWITMISGRSTNKHDPDPSNQNFYYYTNAENFNIKVPVPKIFVQLEVKNKVGPPYIKQGEPGDFYKDTEDNIYIHIDGHVIDHLNRHAYDCFNTNLREITMAANTSNTTVIVNDKKCKYRGVRVSENNTYRSSIVKRYSKTFSTAKDAALFYDYHILALRGVMVETNNLLSIDTQKEILLKGFESIPKAYQLTDKKRDLPVCISRVRNTYRVSMIVDTEHWQKETQDYQEALKILESFKSKREAIELQKKLNKIEENKHNVDGKYGYIIPTNEKTSKIKLDIETYNIFLHTNWSMNTQGVPFGSINGKVTALHIAVIEYYIKDYDKELFGTIDHRFQDYYDCTIEHLRPATYRLQCHNKQINNYIGYANIETHGINFNVKFNHQSKSFTHLKDAIIYRNQLVNEEFGFDDKGVSIGNIIPVDDIDNCTVEDLYHISKLNISDIEKACIKELISIYYVNDDVCKFLNEHNIVAGRIKSEISNEIKQLIIKQFF